MSKQDKSSEDAFDPREFCQRHFKVSAWANERSQVYTTKELIELVTQTTELFKNESPLAEVMPPCVIVGDIHGQYRDLIRILGFSNSREKDGRCSFGTKRFMFLGDYVDRGPHSVECICLVFSLKLYRPKQFMLLRGNHETKAINFAYGFREELINKLGQKDGVDIWERFNEAFSWMPLAGLVGTKILCMHGGISPHLTSLDDIRRIERPLPEINNAKLAQDLLWADPLDHQNINSINEIPQYHKNGLRGLSYTFNETAVKDTCKRLNLDLIVRAHQVMDNGFKFFADRKLITIFSAPKYMNESNNKGAVLRVSGDGAISITTLRSKAIQGAEKAHEATRGDDIDETGTKKKKKNLKENKTQSMSSNLSQQDERKSKEFQ